MRTKTLVLTALGSLSALGLMAQTSTNVYSLNAVGYINLTVHSGYTIIADQLADSSGSNSVNNLLNNADGHLDGSVIYKWNPSSTPPGFAIDTADSLGSGTASGWDNNGIETLNPGEAAWIYVPPSLYPNGFTFTFVGTVPQGTNTVALTKGFNMASSVEPQAGDLITNMGLTNYNNGDVIYVFNNTGNTNTTGYAISTVDETLGTGYNNDFDGGDPVLNVGQGFWYYTTAATGVTWTRNFSVNN